MDSQSPSSERQVETEPAAKRPKKEESLQEKVKRGREKLEKELEYMKQLLARKDEQLARKDEQLARKDEQLARKDEQLARKDEQLAKTEEKNKQLRAEIDEQIAKKDAQPAKIDEQIAKKDEETKQLRAQLERESKRRLIENPPSMSLIAFGCRESSTASSNHIAAKAIEHEVALETFSGGLSCSSHLLLNFGVHTTKNGADDNLVRDYTSEADVRSYVDAALKDAVELVESATGRSFHVFHECSLFSKRPRQLVVVDKETMVPVLAVVVKKPWKDTNNEGREEISGAVLGQVYDCLQKMQMEGHATPFVVLSSFKKSWLLWLDNASSNNLIERENRLSVLLMSPGSPASPTTKSTATTEYTLSAPSISDCVFEGIPRDNMHRSKEAYSADKLVPLLYTAAMCGLSGLWRELKSGRSKSSVSKRLGGYDGIALRMAPKDYGWGTLKLAEGKSVSQQWESGKVPYDDKTYFVVGTIARGATSKALDAYDSSGNRCVIKMYLEEAVDSIWNPLEGDGEKACKLEVQRLQTFYGFLKGKVHYTLLYEYPCVIMPFFEPLTQDEQRNKSKGDMTEIRDCLLSFRDGHGGHWKYSDDDLHWYHVGYFREGNQRKLVMFDLASLETVEETEFESTVASQVEDLKKHLPLSATEQ